MNPKRKKSTKHTKELSTLKKKYIEYYGKLPLQNLAAESIGRDQDTIIRWKKNDKEFADQVALVKSEWALDKVGKVKSAEWLLERVLREEFTEKKDVQIETSEKIEAALDRIAKLLP